MTISATDIVVPVCSKIPLLYLLTQKVAQKFGYVLGIFYVLLIKNGEEVRLAYFHFSKKIVEIIKCVITYYFVKVKIKNYTFY